MSPSLHKFGIYLLTTVELHVCDLFRLEICSLLEILGVMSLQILCSLGFIFNLVLVQLHSTFHFLSFHFSLNPKERDHNELGCSSFRIWSRHEEEELEAN